MNVGPRRCSGGAGGGGACAVVITSATDGQFAADLEHHLVEAAENSRGVFTIWRHPGDPREGPATQPLFVSSPFRSELKTESQALITSVTVTQ